MSARDEVRAYVEGLEKRVAVDGWDQPPVLHRLFFDWNSGALTTAVFPLQFMHPHAPTALETLAYNLETGRLPLSVWPKVGERALVCLNEAWMSNPEAWPARFRSDVDAATEGLYDDKHAYDQAMQAVYRKHYGRKWSMKDVPGSIECRFIAVVQGKDAMAYVRKRGREPQWLGEDGEGEFEIFGRLHAAMTRVQAASRVAG